MMLYVNGDSHSHGMDLSPQEKFSNIVATTFGIDVVNHATVAASNTKILRTTREYLAINAVPDLIIIGWSSWEREEWKYQDQYCNVNSSGHHGLPNELQDLYKNWVLEQTPETLNKKSAYWHDEIYKFHQELTQKNIKHLFFNCMYNFFNIDNCVNWNNAFIEPYNNDASYYWWLTNQGFTADKWYHFGADGHAAWGLRLINYIKEHKII